MRKYESLYPWNPDSRISGSCDRLNTYGQLASITDRVGEERIDWLRILRSPVSHEEMERERQTLNHTWSAASVDLECGACREHKSWTCCSFTQGGNYRILSREIPKVPGCFALLHVLPHEEIPKAPLPLLHTTRFHVIDGTAHFRTIFMGNHGSFPLSTDVLTRDSAPKDFVLPPDGTGIIGSGRDYDAHVMSVITPRKTSFPLISIKLLESMQTVSDAEKRKLLDMFDFYLTPVAY